MRAAQSFISFPAALRNPGSAIPTAPVIEGRYCRLERLDPRRHAAELFEADQLDTSGESWTYLPYGPFTTLAEYRGWIQQVHDSEDPKFYAIVTAGRTAGVLSFLRVQPEVWAIEVGHVHYSPLLQRRRAATEAQYLLASHVFDELGYRRLEWKCDALNAGSRAAAQRLGFSYEGTFRQATVVKGRNRDTAWLNPDNFDAHGNQRTPLRSARSQAAAGT
ncbi:GNAT family N-acetyltransferase [Amycolatopsis lurida]